MKYRADIDGLRALAVLPVVLFHAHVIGFSGGFVGVDVFFVISGYLICSLITTELKNNDFSIVRFYERRCRRILPALFAMFFVVAVLAFFVLLPPDMDGFCKSLISSTFFVSNIYFWRSSSYFDGSSEFKPLLHTWSLGVEEQFYIFVPLILYAIARWSSARYTRWLLLLTFLSFLASVWGLTNAPTANFYLLPTRFWELAVGALLAVNASTLKTSRAVNDALGLTGIALIAFSVGMLSEESSFPSWNALFPCVGAALVIYSGGSGDTFVSRLLSTKVFVSVGKISYSLYLWHWPLLALTRYQVARELSPFDVAAVLLASFIFAILSLRYVEMPVRQNRLVFNSKFVFKSSIAVMVFATVSGVAGVVSGGGAFRYPNFAEQVIPGRERYNGPICYLDEKLSFRGWQGDQCFLTNGHQKTVLLWGDSYAAHYVPGIVDQADSITVNILQYTLSACPPVFDYYTAGRPECQAFNNNLPAILKKYGVSTVVMAGRWESVFKRGVSPDAVVATAKRLIGMGVEVIVIGQSPVFNNNVQTLFAQSSLPADALEASAPLSFRREINSRLAATLPAGTFIDPLATLCGAADCDYRRDGKFVVWDVGHFSSFGSNLAVMSYFPFFSNRH